MKTPILLATALVLLTSSAFAQTFKVLKVKGNKAIIQVPKGITLDQGAKYSIDSEGSAEAPRLNENAESRQYVTGGTVELFFGSQRQESASGTASSSTTEFATDLKFGWNKGQMEYGPLALIAMSSTDSTKETTLGVGGFYDYNFAPNVYGTHILYGVGAKASIGSVSEDRTFGTTTTSTSGTALQVGAGPFAKWFAFGHSTCVRVDARLDISRISMNSTTVTETGLRIAAGLETYF